MISIHRSYSLSGIILLAALMGCASTHRFSPPEPLPPDNYDIPPPEARKSGGYAQYFERQFTDQVEQAFDLSRHLRKLAGKPKQAYNCNAFDEVENSTWFTNRNHVRPMTVEEIARGPNTGDGPDTTNIWTIIRAKNQGITPGFVIEDARGDRYLIKFDPKGYPELATGAEVVSTKLFYALGFNVPENYITYFRPEQLRLGENVTFTDEKGRKRPMRQEDIDAILAKVDTLSDGRIRALASKYLPGKPLGPFSFKGTRDDDPNDLIPHEHRRELRGLRVMAAWLNHFDTKDDNTLDMYVEENGRHFVRHYLIDFGSTLGSAAYGPNELWRGHEHMIDPNRMLANLFSLGLLVRPWEKQTPKIHPSVGYFEAELFHPHKYKAQMPNPAFENMTNLDAFWATKIIMSLTEEQIAAAVKAGQYSDPAAEQYILKTLLKRREKIARFYYRRVNCLDKFRLVTDEEGIALTFIDLAVEAGLEDPLTTEYRYRIREDGRLIGSGILPGSTPRVPLAKTVQVAAGSEGHSQWEITLRIRRDKTRRWGKWVR
ncbi:MAG: hypothetical protein D6681_10875, partial [Calditrichaeota bacterium]